MTYLFDFPHGPKVGAKKYVTLLLDSIHYVFLNNSGIEFSFGPGNWKYLAAIYVFVKFRLKKHCVSCPRFVVIGQAEISPMHLHMSDKAAF